MNAVLEQRQLPGGCPLWLLHRPGPAILSAKLWLRGGSSADPAGQRGAAQLLAGVLSRGCGELSGEQLADLVEGHGAGLRCEAAEDGTLISLKCASDDAAVLLPLLLQMVQSPWLVDDQIALERQLNLQTLQRQREDPFQLSHDQLRQQLYGNGPYGHDPLGVEADLESLGRRQLVDLAEGLGRSGSVLVLAGAIPANVEQLLLAGVGGAAWPAAAPERQRGPAGQPGAPLASCCDETEQLVLMLGCSTVPLGSPEGLALRLLQCHLGVGMSSRLFVALREEQGLAYDVGVHQPARLGDAPFVFHLSSSSDRAAQATAGLLAEWQRLLDTPLSADELQLARAKFRGQEAMGRQTSSQLADRLALVLGHSLPPDFAGGRTAAPGPAPPQPLRPQGCPPGSGAGVAAPSAEPLTEIVQVSGLMRSNR
jgi:zinc protease